MKIRTPLFRKPWPWLLTAAVAVSAIVAIILLWPRSTETETLRRLVILYTNDEHGWMESTSKSGGAAGMMRQWMRQEGYNPNDEHYLVLSGGDRWTGPAISTYFDGQSTNEVMNAMGYDAAAIGNHDFDFGLETLRQRAAEAQFPFLSANIRDGKTDQIPDFARPYIIIETNGIRIGVIGLTTTETPVDTQPATVAGLDFLPYKDALQEFAPQAKAEGAELLIVVGHICGNEMRALEPLAQELGISIIAGGHCHEGIASASGDFAIIQAKSFWQTYGVVELTFDTAADRVVSIEVRLRDNPPGLGDPQIAEVVSGWRARLDADLGQVIGYTNNNITWSSDAMARLLTSAWLAADPSAQIAFASPRYIQTLPAGDITLASVLTMLPTDNRLLRIELTGAQLVEVIEFRTAHFGGLIRTGDGYQLADGSPLDYEAIYRVLLPENLYNGGNYYNIRQYDPDAEDTGDDWRQPIVDWIAAQGSTRDNPLENFLQPQP